MNNLKKTARRLSGVGTNLQTGNRVYNGGSPSPHAGGGLNKSGFLKRDQEANVKKTNLLKQRLKSGGF